MAQFDKMVKKNKTWKALKKKRLKEERRKWMQDAHREAIREFREDDPPKRECPLCLKAFHTDHLADSHMCDPSTNGFNEVSAYFMLYHAKPLVDQEKDGFFTKLFKPSPKKTKDSGTKLEHETGTDEGPVAGKFELVNNELVALGMQPLPNLEGCPVDTASKVLEVVHALTKQRQRDIKLLESSTDRMQKLQLN